MTEITITDAGSRPAPGRLALVQAFVNTVDLETGKDAIASPDLLGRWFVDHGLAEAGHSWDEAAHARAVAMREALRSILLANNGAPLAPDAPPQLDDLGREAPLMVNFDDSGKSSLVPHAIGAHAALARLLAIVHDADVSGTWARLKACANDRCRWAFYDSSKNRSGTWCTMAVCGSRVKSRAYRQRQRPTR